MTALKFRAKMLNFTSRQLAVRTARNRFEAEISRSKISPPPVGDPVRISMEPSHYDRLLNASSCDGSEKQTITAA